MEKEKNSMTNFNREKTAVALSYSTDEKAPKVVASGHGYLAEKIIGVAKEQEVPIHEDKKLAKTLAKLDIGEFIPPELYSIVAEILVYVDTMDTIKGKVLPDA